MTAAERDRMLALDDAALARECELDFFKATGPGGQKRNKTSSAVRVIHRASALAASDCTERQQSRNRALALAKLRMQAALQFRFPPSDDIPLPACSPSHRDYPLWCARLLDRLAAAQWEPRAAAALTGGTPTGLVKLLARDPRLWQTVNAERVRIGRPPLVRP